MDLGANEQGKQLEASGAGGAQAATLAWKPQVLE